MLELMLRLELSREKLRKKILPMASNNNYHIAGAFLALIFSTGTLVTGFTITAVSLPSFDFSLVVFVAGLLAILSVVLFPVGIILL